MSTQNFFKCVNKFFPQNPTSKSDLHIANSIIKILINSQSSTLQIGPSLTSSLTPHITHLVLTNPQVPTQSCLQLFNLLQRNPSQKPTFQTVLALVTRLFKARKYAIAKNILNQSVISNNLRYPFCEIASLVSENCEGPKVVVKLFDMLFRVYADTRRFQDGLEVFEYMVDKGFEIDERSCMVYLLALKRCSELESLSVFFRRMVESGVSITVYSMTIAIDTLCKVGDVNKARELMDEVGKMGTKPNVYTYNTLIDAYVRERDFGGVEEMLSAMENEGVTRNVATYTLLTDGYSSNVYGKIEDVEKMLDEMRERGIEPDVQLYNSIISWNCKLGNMKRAFALFDELPERGVVPNVHTYGALIYCVCKAGNMDAAEILHNEMQRKGIEVNLVILNTLMDGYCKNGMIDEAWRLQSNMEKRGWWLMCSPIQ
ncbi:hypothetical protein RJ639_023467 [Escallonia herrerae]|uniref:Pentatricopeptide repeat-containing protein n=1 Tax=Escallonia herrerae TaxID=1293975 RepID=A0AA88V0G9_9ASTE|nr:hypothetical protein RJ639_023467 [Escallonia herrerae]